MTIDPELRSWLLSSDPDRPDPGGVSAALRMKMLRRLERSTLENLKNDLVKGGPGSGNFDHAGRPGEVGGSAPGGGGGGSNSESGASGTRGWVSPGGFAHTGIQWQQDTNSIGRPIPIHVSSIDKAVPLILAGKVVEVSDVRTAYTILDRLGAMAAEAKAAGLDAPEYDLCNVSVKGSNLFCGSTIRTAEFPDGIPRLKMPQLGGVPIEGSEAFNLPRNPWDKTEVDGGPAFVSHLRGLGIKTKTEAVPASSLRASQREMLGSKVGAMMRNKKFDPAVNPLFVSRDNYIVDGHHRWAAIVGRDLEDGKLGNSMANIIRVDAPISEVLHIANMWTKAYGIKQAAGVFQQSAELKSPRRSGYAKKSEETPMPVGPYEDFDECVAAQIEDGQDEETAKRICGRLESRSTKMKVLEKSDPVRRYTLGVVYSPDEVDTQGEFATAPVIEQAAWAFMGQLQSLAKSATLLSGAIVKASRGDEIELDLSEIDTLAKSAGLDDEHLQVSDDLGTIVESYIAPCDMTVAGQPVKKGSWLLGVVWEPSMFDKITAGERTGFSMYGRAERA